MSIKEIGMHQKQLKKKWIDAYSILMKELGHIEEDLRDSSDEGRIVKL